MYIQPDFIIRRLAEKATADASLVGQQPYKAASSGDLDWFGGAITKHCQGDDTDVKTLVAALLTAHEAITVDEHAWPGKLALLQSAASDAGPAVHDEVSHSVTLNPGPQPDAVVVFDVPSGSPLGLLEVHDAMFSSGANIDLSKANH